MPRRILNSADRARRQDEEIRTTSPLHDRLLVGPSRSNEEEDMRAASRLQQIQFAVPDRSDEEDGENPNELSSHGRDRGVNQYGEPLSPPPPYSPPDSEQGHGLREDRVWSNDRVNLYPGEGGRPEYVTDSTGRRERYVIDGFGRRVPWPYADRENSSYNGDEDPDMIYLESGRVLPRAQWEAEHPTEYSSDGSVEGENQDAHQSDHGGPRPTRDTTPRHWNSDNDDSDREIPRPRGEHRARSRQSGRQSLAGRGGRFGHEIGERPPHLESRARCLSDDSQEESSVDSTDSERSDEAQARYYRVWGSTGISFEMASSTGGPRS